MLCQNCGKNEANIRYTQIINGVKKQMSLCSICAEELGLEDIGFDMPIDFSSFLGDVFEDTAINYIPNFINEKQLKCNNCNMTYEEFTNVGRFGCEHCYETFSNKIDTLLKSVQGSNRHVGRLANGYSKEEKNADETISKKDEKTNEIQRLQERLKQEIKEERYEDAAKTRDEIKKMQGN